MDSNLVVELYVIKKSCQDLFKESNSDQIKIFELDNHVFLRVEGLQLAGPSARALSPASWRPSKLQNTWLSSSKIFHPISI